MKCAWCGEEIVTEHLKHSSGELVHFDCNSEYSNSRGIEVTKIEETKVNE